MIRVLAVSGSLRRASSNTAVLGAAARAAPDGMEVTLYAGLAQLPAFNPDDDGPGAAPPEAVAALRKAVDRADALLLAVPEYAHGVPGALKNALDWLVSVETFPGKPVALINASPRATHAQAALREVLATMSARVVEEACVSLTPPRGGDAGAMEADADCAGPLRRALAELAKACGQGG